MTEVTDRQSEKKDSFTGRIDKYIHWIKKVRFIESYL